MSNRRDFLKKSAALTAGAFVVPTIVPSTVFGKNAPSNRINVGAIGIGRISRDHDLPGIMKYDQLARVIAVSDVDSKRLNSGQQFVLDYYKKKNIAMNEVRMYNDYREMLLNKDIDAIVISTPDHWHAKPAIDAAYAGKHVYLQKPFSLTVREGRTVSNVVNKMGITFQHGTQQRAMPQFRIAAELVRNGKIGQLKTIKVGLPSDPSGEEEPEMPIPSNLNYEMWLGSTPWVYYTEKRVHPQNDYSRPGWLRCEQFGAGMITGWGVHHMDIAHWAMNTEYSGPSEIQATAEFPTKGLWNVHGKYFVEAWYENGVKIEVSGDFPNGLRFEGTEGWIFVSRGNYSATANDPVAKKAKDDSLQASDPKILTAKIDPAKDQLLYKIDDQHGNWLDCIRNGQKTICPAEVGHRSTACNQVFHIAMKLKRKLFWDPKLERFKNDDDANAMLERPQRAQYAIRYE